MKESSRLFAVAERIIPGGVNSPVRAFRGVGGQPFFVARAEGARIWDVDGRAYLDFVGSWGPLLLGHAPAGVVAAVREAVRQGTSYGAPTAREVEMAEAITSAYPSMEMVRLVSSGTEAAMSALRLARGFTGRDMLVKFDGCYHGHADSLLVKAGSGGATFSIPDSQGVPAALAALTLTAPFNDLDAVRDLFRAKPDAIAAVIVEPVAGNMGVVAPAPGFLEGLREITSRHGALLIFDEVITGFRVAYGGAQERYGVRPDLTCLGKIVGGGLPIAAYGGRREVMTRIAPLGAVYQAGTLSGNPLAVAAGLATLEAVRAPGVYATLERLGARMEQGLRVASEKSGVALTINRVGSMLTAFFCDAPVTDYASARRADTARYARYFHAMLAGGVFLAPSQFEAAFVSLAHSERDIDEAARAAAEALTARFD
jgi:glutamate-1-semialdehyde 2,1-aminomutase